MMLASLSRLVSAQRLKIRIGLMTGSPLAARRTLRRNASADFSHAARYRAGFFVSADH
jgi:hypothetical protein